MRRDVFQAIADPTRREIIMLIAGKPLPLNSIAENFEVSRPAISKHIKILTECGIVTIHTRGRLRYCEAQLQKLDEVTRWVEHFRAFWNQKLDALGEYLEKNAANLSAEALPPLSLPLTPLSPPLTPTAEKPRSASPPTRKPDSTKPIPKKKKR